MAKEMFYKVTWLINEFGENAENGKDRRIVPMSGVNQVKANSPQEAIVAVLLNMADNKIMTVNEAESGFNWTVERIA